MDRTYMSVIVLTRGVHYHWNTKLHQMVMDEFIMLEKHADHPEFMPMGLLGLETQGSMLENRIFW